MTSTLETPTNPLPPGPIDPGPVTRRLGLAELFSKIRVGASDRDRDHDIPYGLVDELKQAGIGALRLPVEAGGHGISLVELFDVVADLASADPSIAHALRNHFGFVENALSLPVVGIRGRLLEETARGKLVFGSYGERTTPTSGDAQADFTTTVRKRDGQLLLRGEKFYSTGNLYADYLVVKGNWETGKPVTVAIPATRVGIDRTDDWDGIGQRLTGSGSTRYFDVIVRDDEVLPEDGPSVDRYEASFAQLYLTTVIAGIVRSIVADSVEAVNARSRNYFHGQADHPSGEAVVHHTIGQISAYSFAVTSAVRAAAQVLDAAVRATDPDERAELRLAAALDVSKAKVIADELAGKAGWLLFETGGASTTSQSKNLDRHWRNARTLSSHNPGSYKLRYLGAYEVNGDLPPPISYF
ncbi:acyl-CoA dehydrogenase family protein [Rhodococcus globerulus]|uniref:acyl-CoA dehydrogenase family protein n=1 Tax=Rhodococcus globerulus TaxID=33008 RepID=UPI0030191F15